MYGQGMVPVAQPVYSFSTIFLTGHSIFTVCRYDGKIPEIQIPQTIYAYGLTYCVWATARQCHTPENKAYPMSTVYCHFRLFDCLLPG
jgi:hypothetical protein